MIRLGILGSTRGSNLDAMVKAIHDHQLEASIAIVISNKSSALILERARSFGLLAECVDPKELTREVFDLQVSDLLQQHAVDLVVLIGYMRILSGAFITRWKNRVINVHPSLLPAHAGLMDLEVHRAVLASGDRETGCSVHYVTEEVDAGPVIVQEKYILQGDESPEILKKRVQLLEGSALVKAIRMIDRE